MNHTAKRLLAATPISLQRGAELVETARRGKLEAVIKETISHA